MQLLVMRFLQVVHLMFQKPDIIIVEAKIML